LKDNRGSELSFLSADLRSESRDSSIAASSPGHGNATSEHGSQRISPAGALHLVVSTGGRSIRKSREGAGMARNTQSIAARQEPEEGFEQADEILTRIEHGVLG
jgi:hypothetical protein